MGNVRYNKENPKIAYVGELINHRIYWEGEVPGNLKELLDKFREQDDISQEIISRDVSEINYDLWYVKIDLARKAREEEDPSMILIIDFFKLGKFYKHEWPNPRPGDKPYYEFEPSLELIHICGPKKEVLELGYIKNIYKEHQDIEKLKEELMGSGKSKIKKVINWLKRKPKSSDKYFIKKFIEITEEEKDEILNRAVEDGFLERVLKD